MISLPSYNLPLNFKQFLKSYLTPRSTSKFYASYSTASIDLKKSRFLIISDDPFTSFVFGRSIEKWNGRVDIATTEAQVLANIRSNTYKAILVDIKSNETSDMAFQVVLKNIGWTETQIIALIDETTEHLKEELKRTGFEKFLDKEITPAELSREIADLV